MRFTIVANDFQRLGERIHKHRPVSIAARTNNDPRVAVGRKGPVTQEWMKRSDPGGAITL